VLGNSSGTQSQTWVISLLLFHGVLCAGLKILVGWALEFRHFWGFNQASKLAFSGWSQIKIALVLILLTAAYTKFITIRCTTNGKVVDEHPIGHYQRLGVLN